MSPSGSRLIRGDQGAAGSLGGTAVSPSHQRFDEVRGSSAVWAAVRPDNQGGYPVEPVRYGHTGRGSPPLAQAEIQTKLNPSLLAPK